MKHHHPIRMKNAFVWRYPEAPLDLARALGQIAADLWVAGKLSIEVRERSSREIERRDAD